MEVSVFTKPVISRLLDRFVEMRLHTDDKNAALAETFKQYQDRLVNNQGLPSYAIIEPDQPEKLLGKYIGMDISRGPDFAKFLEDYLAKRR